MCWVCNKATKLQQCKCWWKEKFTQMLSFHFTNPVGNLVLPKPIGSLVLPKPIGSFVLPKLIGSLVLPKPMGRLVWHEPARVPLMAGGTEMTVFLKRTCPGLKRLYLDCSPDRGRSGALSHRGSSGPHPGSTQLPPHRPDFWLSGLRTRPWSRSSKIEATEAMSQMLHPRLSPAFNLGRRAADSLAAAAVAEKF